MSCIDFAKSGCANLWAEVQTDDFQFVCRGCMTVNCLQEQVNELRHMILMMTGQGEREESRGSENEESRCGENKESSGNVREKAGKKKTDGKRINVQQKEDKRVSERDCQVAGWSRITRPEEEI